MVTTMTMHTPPESSKILDIYLLIAQYPMLASDIRRRMREELFRRGIITPQRFDAEVKEKAILSQQREGICNAATASSPTRASHTGSRSCK